MIFVKKLISHVCACAWYKADFKERLLVKKLISHICACAWYKADFKERLLVKKLISHVCACAWYTYVLVLGTKQTLKEGFAW